MPSYIIPMCWFAIENILIPLEFQADAENYDKRRRKKHHQQQEQVESKKKDDLHYWRDIQ